MNAFAEMQVTPLYSPDGMRSQGKSVRIADETAEKGWNEIGVVSPNYLLVHNAKAKEVVDNIARLSGVGVWKQRKLFFDGKRFVYSVTSDIIMAEVAPGDAVRFGLIVHNSYDGSRALSVGAYAEHLICGNGMTSETHFTRFSFRHQSGNINWDEETERAFLAIIPSSKEKLSHFAGTLLKLKRRELTMFHLKILRENYLSELSVNSWGKIVDRFLSHEGHNAFGLLDACTRIFWHNDRQSYSDYRNNSYATDAMIEYAERVRS